jgi:hypothetical protein
MHTYIQAYIGTCILWNTLRDVNILPNNDHGGRAFDLNIHHNYNTDQHVYYIPEREGNKLIMIYYISYSDDNIVIVRVY